MPHDYDIPPFTREYLHAYIDGALSPEKMEALEVLAPTNSQIREQLLSVQIEFDNHNHTIGSLWRRNQLTCPAIGELADHLRGELAVINPELADYVEFHLNTYRCIYCMSNLAELKERASTSPSP